MRTHVRLLAVLGTATVMLSATGPARADGGSFIVLDKTYYLAGDRAVGTAYVSIPKKHRELLNAGPFYAFALPRDTSLVVGVPIPSAAVRLGTFRVQWKNGSYQLAVHFTMPELPPGVHTIALCNDPCTIAGFREALQGTFDVRETPLEIELLRETGVLRGKLYRARRELKMADKRIDEMEVDLASALRTRDELSFSVADLQQRLDASEALVESESVRPLIHPWAAAAVCAALLTLVFALLLRRRHPARTLRPWTSDRSLSTTEAGSSANGSSAGVPASSSSGPRSS